MQCKNTFGGQEVLVYVHSVDLHQVIVSTQVQLGALHQRQSSVKRPSEVFVYAQ